MDQCCYELVADDGDMHRCAIGCLLLPSTLGQIRDFTKIPTSEGQRGLISVADFMGNFTELVEHGYALPELDDVNHDFLKEAQTIHDDESNWHTGKFLVEELDDAARRHGLTVVTDEPARAPREAAPA